MLLIGGFAVLLRERHTVITRRLGRKQQRIWLTSCFCTAGCTGPSQVSTLGSTPHDNLEPWRSCTDTRTHEELQPCSLKCGTAALKRQEQKQEYGKVKKHLDKQNSSNGSNRQALLCVSEVTTCELDVALQNFYAELKKHNGTDYEPESLRTMLAALDEASVVAVASTPL